jgi:hypothetical protein
MINIEIKHYAAGAWVSRTPFLLLNPNTGKTIVQDQNPLGFEKKFMGSKIPKQII